MYGAHVADLFVVNFGDDNERARRAAEREASRARVRGRYTELLRQSAGLDEASAQLAMAVLFDHFDERGEACLRSCHPKLPDEGDRSHDVCFDCPCTWNSERREREKAKSQDFWDEWHNGPEAEARRVASDLERGAVQEWISAPPGVEAKQTGSACPETWEGRIDGRSFYFRERHGLWSIEIDLEPNGRFANRFVGTSDDGEMVTEPVELTSGEVIAEGAETDLHGNPVDHLRFIVDTVRTYLRQSSCTHPKAARYCPEYGARTET